MSWIVGEAGVIYTILIIALATVVTTLTTISMSAICTNGIVKGRDQRTTTDWSRTNWSGPRTRLKNRKSQTGPDQNWAKFWRSGTETDQCQEIFTISDRIGPDWTSVDPWLKVAEHIFLFPGHWDLNLVALLGWYSVWQMLLQYPCILSVLPRLSGICSRTES